VGTKRISNANLVNLTVIFAMFLWSFSAGVVNISLPTIAQFLDISTAQASWVIIGHMLVLVSTLLFFARLSDYIGHKTIFMWGLLIFIISSYLCGLSLDIYLLIFYRLTMGLGSAMLLSVSPAIISTVSTFDVRGRAFGYISLATTLGLSVGYLVGGFITENLGWNYVFFLSVPLGVVVLLMAQAHFKHLTFKKEHNHSFDVTGALLSFFFFLVLILTLETMGDTKMPFLYTMIGVLASIVMVLVFVVWELRHPHPLVNLKLFLNPYLSMAVGAAFLTTLILTGTIFLIPFYLELVKSYTTEFSGLLVFASTLLVVVVGPLSGWLSDRLGAKKINTLGAIFLLIALALFTLMDSTVGLLFIFMALAIRSLSDGISNPANSKMVISHSPPGMLNTVSGLLNAARYFGLVIGVVVFQSIFNNTISKYALTLDVSASGALEMTLPIGTLAQGFQAAFSVGVILSVRGILFTILGCEDNNPAL